MKITLKQLIDLAKSAGYEGETNEACANEMLAFVKKIDGTVTVAGNTVECKTIEVEAKAVERKSFKVEDDSPKAPAKDDTDAIVKSAVETALKAAGVDIAKGKRPNLSVADETVEVKSGVERRYDDRPASQKFFKNAETSFAFSDYLRVSAAEQVPSYWQTPGVRAAAERLNKRYSVTKNYGSGTDAGGAALVATAFAPDIQRNIEMYGVANKVCKVIPMATDTTDVPSSANLHTMYYPDQGSAPSYSTNLTFQRNRLTAKKAMGLLAVNNEVIADSNPAILDHLADVATQTIAYNRDAAVFNGDGTATYGNMVGVINKITAASLGTYQSTVAGGGDWSAHTMTHLTKLVGSVKALDYSRCAWLGSQQAIGQVLMRLAQAQGGVTYRETAEFGLTAFFLGFPVIPVQVMNQTASTGASTVDFFFGDMSRSVLLGDRMSAQIDTSGQPLFTSDATVLRLMTRFDVNVWDVGSASSFAPIAALYQT